MVELRLSSSMEFYRDCRDKSVICFGAGQYLERYAKESYYIAPVCIADNLATGTRTVNGAETEIISFPDLLSRITNDNVIVITASRYDEILDQMDAEGCLDGVPCYIPYPFFDDAEREKVEVNGYDSGFDLRKVERIQIVETHPELFNAGSKAPADISNIWEASGIIPWEPSFRAADDTKKDWKFRRLILEWDRFFDEIKEGVTIFLQHPFWSEQEIRRTTLRKLKEEKNIRIVALLHDLEKLRNMIYSEHFAREEEFVFQWADILIVHNDVMRSMLIADGIRPERIVTLEMFDYLCKEPYERKAVSRKDIVIAGNLSAEKNPHLRMLNQLANLTFHLYGDLYDGQEHAENVIYHGVYDADALPDKLTDGFGLVWGGDALDTCSGASGEYLKYNNPHKLSLYLAAGLPVIVWSGSATASFVRTRGVGLAVDSLFELPQILDEMTQEEVEEMQSSATAIGKQIREGYYTKRAIEIATRALR